MTLPRTTVGGLTRKRVWMREHYLEYPGPSEWVLGYGCTRRPLVPVRGRCGFVKCKSRSGMDHISELACDRGDHRPLRVDRL